MAKLEDFSRGDRVEVLGMEPEDFKDEPVIVSLVVNPPLLRESRGAVDEIDEKNQRILVRLDSDSNEIILSFDPWNLKRVSGD